MVDASRGDMVTHRTKENGLISKVKDTRNEKENGVGVLASIAFAVYTRRVG